jgi:hypothetical protein
MPRKKVTIGSRQLTLDARPDRLDLRDRPYGPRLGNLPPIYPGDESLARWLPEYTRAGLILDQGSEGACTGFGLAAVIHYLRFTRALGGWGGEAAVDWPPRVSPAMLYELARLYDEWPGEDYEGSSCRGALKGWHRHGVCREDLWPYAGGGGSELVGRRTGGPVEDRQQRDDPQRNWDLDALDCTLGVYYRVDTRSVVDLQSAIYETGAVYVSATVHEGWNLPEPRGGKPRRLRGHRDLQRITPVAEPKDAGGHAFALVGFDPRGFVVQNSWGPTWGSGGFALLPYEDWVLHAEDAWVFTLGVPRRADGPAAPRRRGARARTLRAPRFFISSTDLGERPATERPTGLVAGDDSLSRKYRALPADLQPLDTDRAYSHAVVLDRGFPVRNDITAATPAAALEAAGLVRPREWLAEQRSNRLLIYAHGGLNSEAAAIQRARVLAPYALKHGLYPLFLTWRSGPLETVSDLVEELFAKLGFGVGVPARGWLDRLTEKTDRLLEPLLRAAGGALWGQMKLNALRAAEHPDGGTRLLVEHLQRLVQERPKLELHFLGHSAGAIVVGAMLPLLRRAGLKAASVRLFAPACTTAFALEHYGQAIENGTLAGRDFFVHVLSDANERDDKVGPYRKSLLYLVSRSFEEEHKMPLLGLDKSFDPSTAGPGTADDLWSVRRAGDVLRWAEFFAAHCPPQNRVVLSKRNVPTGAGTIDASHGCFDNAVDLMGTALGYAVDRRAPRPVRVHRLDY